ncbi:Ig-like domain-containing protein, partial [Limnohabitans sp.]|uniref:Ig-like domain-containing protein n=1 Tax=Limnohabitans sp. TaxID=1907725 RepID=UPI0039BC856D|nr:Ig-like domain-containing protein [Comamonadaceae bacterium]
SFVIKSGSATIGTIAATDSSQVTFNGSTVTINPANDLAFDTSYTVTATSDVIKDSAGNNWAGTGSNPYDFTTVAKTINGTSGHDNLVGTSGNDDIYGLEGDDTLNGGAGTDKLVGGAGNDTYVVDSTTDTILESTSAGKDVVQSSVNYALGANLENLTLTGTSAINGTGNTLDNTLTGNSGANSLSGGNGNDTLIGGSGNDTLDGGAGSFADTMDGGTGIDTLSYASLTSTLSAGVTLNLGRTKDSGGYVSASGLGGVDKVKGMENILGSAYADVFTGDSTANTLNGGAGNDTLDGGAGSFADTMDGGTGIDTVSYAWV